jgi:hypothetical protein
MPAQLSVSFLILRIILKPISETKNDRGRYMTSADSSFRTRSGKKTSIFVTPESNFTPPNKCHPKVQARPVALGHPLSACHLTQYKYVEPPFDPEAGRGRLTSCSFFPVAVLPINQLSLQAKYNHERPVALARPPSIIRFCQLCGASVRFGYRSLQICITALFTHNSTNDTG